MRIPLVGGGLSGTPICHLEQIMKNASVGGHKPKPLIKRNKYNSKRND